ncbi:MAG TPA: hypothetical protein VG737_05710 [Cyclobacteriaceae bacterium]|nr:hypothetical protein [Cyclobacteriaceae bacterium]
MRTSLIEIRDAEKYLKGEMRPEESLVFEARILTNDNLSSNVSLQQKLYGLLLLFQRKKIKADVLEIHTRLFSQRKHGEFQERIRQIFKQ